jgi:hypothetical protein
MKWIKDIFQIDGSKEIMILNQYFNEQSSSISRVSKNTKDQNQIPMIDFTDKKKNLKYQIGKLDFNHYILITTFFGKEND